VKLTPIRTLSIHCPLLFMDMTCKDINFYLAKFIVSMTILSSPIPCLKFRFQATAGAYVTGAAVFTGAKSPL